MTTLPTVITPGDPGHIAHHEALHALNPLPIFDIEKYGAVANNTTDCTQALQDAIDDAIAAGGGIIVAPTPASEGVYKFTGNLLTGGDGQYAQVRIPHVAPGPTKPFLFFAGPSDMQGDTNNSGGTGNGHAAFRTTKTGSYNGTFGWPSFIGAPDFDKSSHRVDSNYFTNIHVVWGSIMITQPANPSLCALNLESVDTVHIKALQALTDSVPSTPCTNPTGIGLLMPGVQNHAGCKVDEFRSYGHYAGMNLCEHLELGYTAIVFSVIGLAVTRPYFHVAHVNQTVLEQNQYLIAGLDPSTGVVDVPTNAAPATGARPNGALVKFDALMFEDDADGNFKPVQHVKDGNNRLNGYAFAGRILGAFGPLGGFRASGCQQFRIYDLYDPAGGAVQPVGPQALLAPGLPGFHDNFARRDSITMGNTSHGDAHWSSIVGRMGVRFGSARGVSSAAGDAEHGAVIETGVADGAVSAEWADITDDGILIFRYADRDNFMFYKPATSGGGLYKMVAGVPTRLDAFALAWAVGDRFDVSYIGSAIKVFRTTAAGAVTLLGTVTDSTHINNTIVGLDLGGTESIVSHFNFGQIGYDVFTRADGALGTSTLGPAWIQTEANLVRVISNAAGVTSAAEAKALLATGLPDGWVRGKFTVLPGGSSAALIFRYGDTHNYMAWQPLFGLVRVHGDVVTKISVEDATATNNDIYAVEFDGPDLAVWRTRAGTSTLITRSRDPFLARAGFQGLRFADTTSRVDDFMAHPLTAAPYLL